MQVVVSSTTPGPTVLARWPLLRVGYDALAVGALNTLLFVFPSPATHEARVYGTIREHDSG